MTAKGQYLKSLFNVIILILIFLIWFPQFFPQGGVSLFKYLGVTSFGFWFFYRLGSININDRERLPKNTIRIYMALVLFIFIAFSSGLYTRDFEQYINDLSPLIFILGLIVLIYDQINNERLLVRVVKIFAFAGFFASAYMFVQFALPLDPFGRKLLYGGVRRASGLMYDPNNIALAILLTVPCTFYLAKVKKSKKKKYVYFLAAVTQVVAIILTGSRASFIVLLVVLAIIIWKSHVKRKIIILSGAILVAVLFLLFSSGLANKILTIIYVERIWSIHQILNPSNIQDPSLANRIAYLVYGLRMFADHPFFGIGFGSFRSVIIDYGSPIGRVAHNTYLQIAVELGIMGLMAYCILLLLVWRSFKISQLICYNVGRSDIALLIRGLQLSFLAFLLNAFFLTKIDFIQFWILITLSMASYRIAYGLKVTAKA